MLFRTVLGPVFGSVLIVFCRKGWSGIVAPLALVWLITVSALNAAYFSWRLWFCFGSVRGS